MSVCVRQDIPEGDICTKVVSGDKGICTEVLCVAPGLSPAYSDVNAIRNMQGNCSVENLKYRLTVWKDF